MQRIVQFVVWLLLMLAALTQPVPASEFQAAQPQPQQEEPSIVYDLTQDQQDFLWLAAEYDGLLRFDGEAFMSFSPDGQHSAFSYSQVVVTKDNRLWIGTWGHGLWQLDNKRLQWQRAPLPVPAEAKVQSLLYDQAQNLWIGTTEGLYVIYAQSNSAELWQPLAKHRIWQLAQQQDGQLWAATSDGIFKISLRSPNGGQWFEDAGLKDNEVRAIAVRGNSLLLGQRAGLTLFDTKQNSAVFYPTPANTNAFFSEHADQMLVATIDGVYRLTWRGEVMQTSLLLPAVDVRKIFRDQSGRVWLASRNMGLMPLTSTEPNSLMQTGQQYLSPDKKHRLGPPSLSKSGLWQPLEKSLLQQRDGQWRELLFPAEHNVAYVRDLVDFAGMTLVATDQGLFKVQPDHSLAAIKLSADGLPLNVERATVAADGALWLGLWGKGVYRIAAPTSDKSSDQQLPAAVKLKPDDQAQHAVIDMQTDPQQQLWLLSRDGQLYKADAQGLQLVWQPPAGLATGYFHCLLAEVNNFWLCTDRGLLKLSKDTLQPELLGLSAGLPDLRVIGLSRSRDFIWVLTRNGLMAFKPDGTEVRLLSPLPQLNFRAAQLRGIIALDDESIQLSTSEGLWRLNASALTAVPKKMQLHLTEFRLDQTLYSPSDLSNAIGLTDSEHEIQLKFKLLSFLPHLQVSYFYRWQGQTNWTPLGSEAVLTLGQLAPGEHQLEVMAEAAGQRIHTQAVRFDVPTPWWQQPAGIALMLLLLVLLLYLLYRLRITHLQHYAYRLDLLVKQRTTELELANQQLQQLSHTDSLTGLMNRRALQYAANLIQAQRSRKRSPMTLALMDIDHFKEINDSYGHDAGDKVLVQVAHYLQHRLRAQDLLARWGGEEFLILMPDTKVQQALHLVDELRLGLKNLPDLPESIALTATFGLSTVSTQPLALEHAIKAADGALYRGKDTGRDQVVLATNQNP